MLRIKKLKTRPIYIISVNKIYSFRRFWKKIFVRLSYQGDNPVVQLYNAATDKEPFQELPLQACYSVSEIGAQQFDQFGKIFTVKLQYVFYKERPGVRYEYAFYIVSVDHRRNLLLKEFCWQKIIFFCFNVVTESVIALVLNHFNGC